MMEDLVIKIVDVTLRVIVLSFEPDEFYVIFHVTPLKSSHIKSSLLSDAQDRRGPGTMKSHRTIELCSTVTGTAAPAHSC